MRFAIQCAKGLKGHRVMRDANASAIWTLGLKSHVKQDTASTNPYWCQLDDLIKMLILVSLCDSLQEQVVTTPGNAKALWGHLKDLFHDNKDARAITLDNELRSIKIGKMTREKLSNFAVNGLDSRFATLAEIIRHREPLPAFESVRNMLLLKESSFNDQIEASITFESSSSASTILMASSSSEHKGQIAKGNFGSSPNSHAMRLANSWPIQYPPQALVSPVYYTPSGPSHMAQQMPPPQQHTNSGQPFAQPTSNGILGAALVYYGSQPTALPSAFSTMSLQDPTWNMDTCATSHLNFNARNLSTLFNKRLFSSMLVTDRGLPALFATAGKKKRKALNDDQ
nr:hypothetical protein [Tanacetum cinerariifolium]